MANYRYYLVKSLTDVSDPTRGEVGFHLRILNEATEQNPPYLDFDPNAENGVVVDKIIANGKTTYTIHVYLIETNIPKALVYRDRIFSEDKPLDYDNISAGIVAHKTKMDGTKEEEETDEDLVYEKMYAEYPVDQQ